MLATIIRNDKSIRNGISLNIKQATELSKLADVAAVVSLSESPSGLQTVYVNGVAMQYDPVECTFVGHHDKPRGRLSWTS